MLPNTEIWVRHTRSSHKRIHSVTDVSCRSKKVSSTSELHISSLRSFELKYFLLRSLFSHKHLHKTQQLFIACDDVFFTLHRVEPFHYCWTQIKRTDKPWSNQTSCLTQNHHTKFEPTRNLPTLLKQAWSSLASLHVNFPLARCFSNGLYGE